MRTNPEKGAEFAAQLANVLWSTLNALSTSLCDSAARTATGAKVR
jgi:hypothetical protein